MSFEKINAPADHNRGPALYSGGEHDTWPEVVGKINRMFGKLFGQTSEADAAYEANDSDKRVADLARQVEALTTQVDKLTTIVLHYHDAGDMKLDDVFDFKAIRDQSAQRAMQREADDERIDSDEAAAHHRLMKDADGNRVAPQAKTERGTPDVKVATPATTTGGLKQSDQNLDERYTVSGSTGQVSAAPAFGTAGGVTFDNPAVDAATTDSGSLQTSSGFHGLAEAEQKLDAASGTEQQEDDTMKDNGEIETGKDVPFEETAKYEPKSIVKKAGVVGQPAAPELVRENNPDAPEGHAENDIRSPARNPVDAVDNPATPPSGETLARAAENQKNANDTDRG